MTTDDRVMTILERANPVPPEQVPDAAIGADRYLEDLQQRSSTVSIRSTETPNNRRRWAMLGAAAAVLALVVVAAFVIRGDGVDDNIMVDTPDSVPATSAPVTTSTIEATPEPDPVETSQADFASFVDLYNAGDTDGVLALLSDDVIVTAIDAGPPSPESYDPNDPWLFELAFAWNHAQGEAWSAATCRPADEQLASGTTLSCEWETRDGVTRAVDGDPTPTRALVVMSRGAVVELHLGFGFPDLFTLDGPFKSWMATHHPDVEGTDCCAGDTREESEQRGRLRAQWAQEWATWLDEWGCDPRNCTIPIEDWVEQYDLQCLGSDPNAVSQDLVDHMALLPDVSEGLPAVVRLSLADVELVRPGVATGRVAELRQQRLDAMIELGIDERCHPVVE